MLEDRIKTLEEKRDSREKELLAQSDQLRERLHTAEREKVILEGRVTSLESMEGLLKQEKERLSSSRQELQQQEAETLELKNQNSELQHRIQQLNDK